jgi:hypothetical protein
MVQIQRFDVRDRIILTPAIRRPVRTTHEQAVQNGEKHGALHRELVAARCGEIGDDSPASGFLLQPLEHRRRPDSPNGDLRRLVRCGAEHHGFGGKPCAGAEQSFHLPACPELVHTD